VPHEIGIITRVLRGLVVLYGTAFERAKYLIFIVVKLSASGARTFVPSDPWWLRGPWWWQHTSRHCAITWWA